MNTVLNNTQGMSCTGKNNPLKQAAVSLNPPEIDSCSGCVTRVVNRQFVVDCAACGPEQTTARGPVCGPSAATVYDATSQTLSCATPSAQQ